MERTSCGYHGNMVLDERVRLRQDFLVETRGEFMRQRVLLSNGHNVPDVHVT